ncbi:uncharacterized protein BO97DRAFT_223147 [Aspergillus homomorphus CBS 101889]|uniref:Uncharacterized protein n=1 Tax=Aspergillus homomorphus (strain CBS 101889) TaxID=1450537 RepID=A0A395HKT9_ASPHC|nr:hypothetical protein BO97DRAFT_223147 [Aspergillus homomorphus CBS 101889]RAL08226.1 hypothetical protein BO97DRAFT_223147 [Aspergillus homomorphus CBS 101889]
MAGGRRLLSSEVRMRVVSFAGDDGYGGLNGGLLPLHRHTARRSSLGPPSLISSFIHPFILYYCFLLYTVNAKTSSSIPRGLNLTISCQSRNIYDWSTPGARNIELPLTYFFVLVPVVAVSNSCVRSRSA